MTMLSLSCSAPRSPMIFGKVPLSLQRFQRLWSVLCWSHSSSHHTNANHCDQSTKPAQHALIIDASLAVGLRNYASRRVICAFDSQRRPDFFIARLLVGGSRETAEINGF